VYSRHRANSATASGAPRATFSNERASLPTRRVFDKGVRTVDVGIFLREFRFGALTPVVMTMSTPAALP
jgi:hypothetical protein